MYSRISLTLLAMVIGAVVLYVLEYFQLVTVPEYKASPVTAGIVAFGGLCTVVGWIRIFRRRPGAKPDGLEEPSEGA